MLLYHFVASTLRGKTLKVLRKFKISALTKNGEFELPNESFSHIQIFKIILKIS